MCVYIHSITVLLINDRGGQQWLTRGSRQCLAKSKLIIFRFGNKTSSLIMHSLSLFWVKSCLGFHLRIFTKWTAHTSLICNNALTFLEWANVSWIHLIFHFGEAPSGGFLCISSQCLVLNFRCKYVFSIVWMKKVPSFLSLHFSIYRVCVISNVYNWL